MSNLPLQPKKLLHVTSRTRQVSKKTKRLGFCSCLWLFLPANAHF